MTAASRPANKRSQSNFVLPSLGIGQHHNSPVMATINYQRDLTQHGLTQNHLRRESPWGIICLALACVRVCERLPKLHWLYEKIQFTVGATIP